MIEHLFGSKTRAGVLRTFFRQPDKAFYVRELARLLEVQINAIRRELEILLQLGLIKETEVVNESKKAGEGLRKYFILDNQALIFGELQALLIKSQLMDEKELASALVDKAGKMDLFLLTGKFTADKRAPSDILLVGNLKEKSVDNLIKKYEKKFGFPIRYTIMNRKEFMERREMMDRFLFSMFEADNIKVVDHIGV
ncbi:helix-turn-helix domain-containing protein [Patescibacteria group bacterium]|nr:helix-turn-helix domain-containing protein [Patescibacteria group bacterium]MBU1895762.1 helix-turn-helix domain-containing protein [Patescibacteria group bacterium]